VEIFKKGSTGIFNDNAMIATIVGLPDGGVDANFRCDATHQQGSNALGRENHLEIRSIKGSFPRFVHNRFTFVRIKCGNDIVTGFPSNQHASFGTGSTNHLFLVSAHGLVRVQIREIGSVSLAGVNDENSGVAGPFEDLFAGRNGLLQLGNVVAEGVSETVGLQEVPL